MHSLALGALLGAQFSVWANCAGFGPWEGLVSVVNASCGGLGSSNKKRSACKSSGRLALTLASD